MLSFLIIYRKHIEIFERGQAVSEIKMKIKIKMKTGRRQLIMLLGKYYSDTLVTTWLTLSLRKFIL